jgi:methyltransferase (TIGR00027 family)
MQDAGPSRTALRVAMRRAAHQLFDAPPVLDDPWAVAIIGEEAVARLKAESWKQQTPAARAFRAFMVARSRFAEDELARAIGRGAAQYVVLGAGLDTFAYRNPHSADALRVFEVDHPATQVWKQHRLASAGMPIPPSLTFVPLDFERDTLPAALAGAGWRRDLPTFFSWLGVMMYLTDEAIQATLDFVAAMPAGGGLAFDYAVPRSSLGWTARLVHDALARRVAAAGEPFRTFFDPRALHERLSRAGFLAIDDLDSDAVNARYFANRADGLAVGGGLARLVSATL